MQKQNKSWFKIRGYPHITNKISGSSEAKIRKMVSNPAWVAKYAFFPLLHKIIPQRRYKIIARNPQGKAIRAHKDLKGNSCKKLRPIHYATHLDAHIYGYYCDRISQKYEAYLRSKPGLSDCVSAYRQLDGKNNINFAKEVFDFIRQKGNCCALAFDIESFFNHLNHQKLKHTWANLLEEGSRSLPVDHYKVFKSITDFSYILLSDLKRQNPQKPKARFHFDEQKLAKLRSKGIFAFFESPQDFREQVKAGEISVYKNLWRDADKQPRGIVQGLPISAMLANLYLLKFDELMLQKIIKEKGGLYRRYSDDIVVICDECDREEMKKLLIDSIKEFKLIIAAAKTEECFFRKNEAGILQVSKIIDGKEKLGQPLRYLGFEFYGDKTLIKSANLSKFYRRMKQAIKTKVRRAKSISEKNLSDEIVIFKRKLLRIYTEKGRKARKLPTKRVNYEVDPITQKFVPKTYETERKYRGNFFNYVQRAARIMDEPAIKNQVRRHKKIFWEYLRLRLAKTFENSNSKQWSKEETLEKW